MNRRSLIVGAAMLLACVTPATAAPTRFAVKVTGKGPDVILIPGLACSGEVWDATVARLSATHCCHVLTIAGFAGVPAGSNAEGLFIAPVVAEIAAYIDAQELNRPAIIGHSIGGFMGLMLAARWPQLAGRLLIVDSLSFYSLLFTLDVTPKTALPFASQNRAMIVGQTDAEFAQGAPLIAASQCKSPEGRAAIVRWSLATDRRVMGQAVYEATISDIRPELAKVTIPVTVLWPHEPATSGPVEVAAHLREVAYAGLKGVQLKRIDNSEHFIMYDQPGAFAREVDVFLA